MRVHTHVYTCTGKAWNVSRLYVYTIYMYMYMQPLHVHVHFMHMSILYTHCVTYFMHVLLIPQSPQKNKTLHRSVSDTVHMVFVYTHMYLCFMCFHRLVAVQVCRILEDLYAQYTAKAARKYM